MTKARRHLLFNKLPKVNQKLTISLLTGVLLFFISSTLIADSSPLISQLTAFKVITDTKGEEHLISATKAEPGDVIEYHSTYTNVGITSLSNVKAILPIPEGLGFIENSPQPSRYLASIDGKRFRKTPLYKTVIKPSGKTKRVKVKPEEYKAIQWYLGHLNKGEVKTVKARAKIKNK